MKQLELEERSQRSEQLLDGVLLKVYRDRVMLPNGKHSIREWIDHPGASAVVPLFEDGSTILVRQYRFPPRREFLEVPAGKIDVPGESPEDVAARELEEETGWRSSRMTHLASLYPCIGYSNELIHIFLAEALTKGTKEEGSEELLENVRMPFDEAVQLAASGQMPDMKTTAAVILAGAFLKERKEEIPASENWPRR